MTEVALHGHRLIEIGLTEGEMAEATRLGVTRTHLNEKELGWTYRHDGMKSEEAHAVGDLGETAVEKWLAARRIPYTPAPKLVKRLEDIQQDITVWGMRIGVKTMQVDDVNRIFQYPTFLYPAKNQPGESRRVLDYPDYLIQAALAPKQRRVWLIGVVDRGTLIAARAWDVKGKPAHHIPHAAYRPCEEWLASVPRPPAREVQVHLRAWEQLTQRIVQGIALGHVQGKDVAAVRAAIERVGQAPPLEQVTRWPQLGQNLLRGIARGGIQGMDVPKLQAALARELAPPVASA